MRTSSVIMTLHKHAARCISGTECVATYMYVACVLIVSVGTAYVKATGGIRLESITFLLAGLCVTIYHPDI